MILLWLHKFAAVKVVTFRGLRDVHRQGAIAEKYRIGALRMQTLVQCTRHGSGCVRT